MTVMQYNLLMLCVTFFCFITHVKTERENHSHTHMDTWSVFSLNFSTGGRQGTPKPLTLNQLTSLSAALPPCINSFSPQVTVIFLISHTHTPAAVHHPSHKRRSANTDMHTCMRKHNEYHSPAGTNSKLQSGGLRL